MTKIAQPETLDRKQQTAANLAVGWQRLIGPALAVSIALFVYVLFEPLLVTRIALIKRSEITLAHVAYDLYGIDTLLFLVVFGFGIVAPTLKLAGTVYVWYFIDITRADGYGRWLVLLGKLSMLDVLLLAVLVVAIKGIGIGSVEIRSGLYAYAILVMGSFVLSLLTERMILAFRRV